ncbi:putative methyltransferase [Lysinibacillus phage vB_LfM_LysYB1]|nr:putative methyltransferase [Lysinibacillus phage vB_LfM_LysYB1]WAB25302.1 putative methyltransferase [Lysinibacillus phage vB_LfM_LysYB2]
MNLDYGSGSKPKKGFKSSDFCGAPGYDYFIKDYRVLDLEDKSCDVIHCRNVIHHIPEADLPLLFGEFKRLLKDNGVLIISEPREEFHEQNKLLDLIWYRFLTYAPEIMVPDKYVDYKKYLEGFVTVHTEDENKNEILTLHRVGRKAYLNEVVEKNRDALWRLARA